jgi:nicotinate-nucleotide--dimethylbenzimidazole phosphoribosyltransferase
MLREDVQNRLDSLTKPKGSLGFLEEIAAKMAMMQGNVIPELPRKKAVYVFAADHGVVAEGVSAYPSDVTPEMVLNMLHGGAAINVLSRHVGSEVHLVDAGVDYDFDDSADLIRSKVGHGTRDFAVDSAMTSDQASQCIENGRAIARAAITQGVELAAIGDMGIGNTTTATAVAAAFGYDLDAIVDIGTKINDDQLKHKTEVIRKAIALHQPFRDPMDVLGKVGGFCLGEMAGFILEFADHQLPVVLDGYPTTAGALIAWKMNPGVTDYLFAGHRSWVRGHIVILKDMGLRPILDLDMRLGEGTGAVLSFSVIEAAVKIMREMATFEDASITTGSEQ